MPVWLGAAIVGLCASLVLVPSALATKYKPNKTGDHVPDGSCTKSDCTVREAISAANGNAGEDVVVLKGGKTYEVTLNPATLEDLNAAADLDVTEDLRIKASGKGLAALDAKGGNRVLDVGPSTDVSATLRNIWVRNGLSADGAGIRAGFAGDAALRLVHSRVTGSETVSGGNGGGIEIMNAASGDSTLEVVKSTISGNRAEGDGGGIRGTDVGLITVDSSTVSGNRAGTAANEATGGGISLINNLTTLEMTNSTVANNRASLNGGGISAFDATAVLKSDTIVRNTADFDDDNQGIGGGLLVGAISNATVRNTILALNTATTTNPGNGDCTTFLGGTVTSQGRNLLSEAPQACSLAFEPNIKQANPHLGKLAANGGPTKTIALKKGSKAINHAGSGSPGRDQRGVKRDSKPDIGAFER
jgi:hypothetical protein